jgi:hypothetical protein
MEAKKDLNPEEALLLEGPTNSFIGPIKDKKYGINFGAFRMRDIESGHVLFEVSGDDRDNDIDESTLADEDKIIKYHFGPDFLELKMIGT